MKNSKQAFSARQLVDLYSELDESNRYWADMFRDEGELRIYDSFIHNPIYAPEHDKAKWLHAVSMDKDNRTIRVRATYPDGTVRFWDWGFEFFEATIYIGPSKLSYMLGFYRAAYHHPQRELD